MTIIAFWRLFSNFRLSVVAAFTWRHFVQARRDKNPRIIVGISIISLILSDIQLFPVFMATVADDDAILPFSVRSQSKSFQDAIFIFGRKQGVIAEYSFKKKLKTYLFGIIYFYCIGHQFILPCRVASLVALFTLHIAENKLAVVLLLVMVSWLLTRPLFHFVVVY